MVKDWAFSAEMKQPITINAILEHNQVIFVQRIADNISNRFLRNCSEIEPIPLTSEILEKNFKEFLPGINLMYELGGPYVASDEEGQWVLGLISKEQSKRYPLVKITYVHELQHALRLCGIDKEIAI